jgi:hypothetical protein
VRLHAHFGAFAERIFAKRQAGAGLAQQFVNEFFYQKEFPADAPMRLNLRRQCPSR